MKLNEFREFFSKVKPFSVLMINEIKCRIVAKSNYAIVVQDIGENETPLDTALVDYNEIKKVELLNDELPKPN